MNIYTATSLPSSYDSKFDKTFASTVNRIRKYEEIPVTNN